MCRSKTNLKFIMESVVSSFQSMRDVIQAKCLKTLTDVCPLVIRKLVTQNRVLILWRDLLVISILDPIQPVFVNFPPLFCVILLKIVRRWLGKVWDHFSFALLQREKCPNLELFLAEERLPALGCLRFSCLVEV